MIVPVNAVYYVEIVAQDVEATRAVYEKVHACSFELTPALGNAHVAALPDGSRLGIRAPLRADEAPIVRTYLRVDDIDRAAAAAAEAGATIAVPPMELPGEGTIVIYLLAGIEQGLWQLP